MAQRYVVIAILAVGILVVGTSWTTEPVQKGTACEGQTPRVDPRLTLAKYKGLLEKEIPPREQGSAR